MERHNTTKIDNIANSIFPNPSSPWVPLPNPIPQPPFDPSPRLPGLNIPFNPLTTVLAPYLIYLRNQGKVAKKLPHKLKWAVRKHFKADMDSVVYYEGVNTVHNKAITIGSEIFFTRKINLKSYSDVKLMLHELEHVEQYETFGGLEGFFREYTKDAIITMLKNFTLTPHYVMEMEKAAVKKAGDIIEIVWKELQLETDFILEVETTLHSTDETYQFLLDSQKNLYAIKKANTESKFTEVHILSAASNYQQYLLNAPTILHETDNTFQFLIDIDKNIYAIKKSYTGSQKTEVHILSAASKYQEYILNAPTILHETDNTFEFLIDIDKNIYAIKKNHTASKKTEVHILSAASKYQEYLLNAPTILHETDNTFQFLIDIDKNIYAIKKSHSDSQKTEVHILSAASKYQEYFLNVPTILHETDNTFEFLLDNDKNLYAIKKNNTPNHLTEVHAIAIKYMSASLPYNREYTWSSTPSMFKPKPSTKPEDTKIEKEHRIDLKHKL